MMLFDHLFIISYDYFERANLYQKVYTDAYLDYNEQNKRHIYVIKKNNFAQKN